jgi:hypothetical protein
MRWVACSTGFLMELGKFCQRLEGTRYHLDEELIRQLLNVRLRGDRDLMGRICEEGVASFVRARD